MKKALKKLPQVVGQESPPLTHAERISLVLTHAHHDYKKALTHHASFKVSSKAVTDDLVQDTFIKTWTYLVKGKEIGKMKSFLYHVLNGLIIDEYRRKKNMSLDVLLENGYEASSSEVEHLQDVFDGKKAVLLIGKLPIAYQKIMKMRYMQGLSLEEISRITGKSKNSMAVKAHRGLEKLKLLYFAQKRQAMH